ncbi:hypothetical protein LX15_002408 [Streptoalloteichus tenebrarius]|uniref:Integral membrane protein n=1 Tax=Streptoalloteichus tenebrarius (strain ATCC 17920 / DSM 40477 / JCM 4838 / CBS 697.72 / NBRC 16177 / NCIMB 11028 / NRRL B-12390 / A12253. 1 / ISP 5477) TaxID=1933 RepID=A0ABT1HTG0_STRSD|nr:hypothetical protein [Streptoalloteichus tenebrarius]MCP2258710.1 hypothetical protein [Streptoalloteichus tenebrarius]BFF02858.1 membrane protein [Streptoalloteichus tenebrarius]
MPTEAAPTPRGVRVAGALTGLQGVAGVGYAVALATQTGHEHGPYSALGTAAYFLVLSAGVLAASVGLLRGRRWARTPSLFVQLVLLGVAWYAFGSAGQHVAGVVVAVFCLAIIVLLFTAESRAWAMGVGPYDPDAPDRD